ncbi:reverse transcriptase domain-containing protein [Citrus sinensis]|uniref:Reverse transcriptase domain-containing protein n=1 Tax=Citrus sinensis TaxID=2711 RepID=A0ACB8NKE4_CITSI|nr:reverse transcriptase domain-containing protein [Citrus sinensis]
MRLEARLRRDLEMVMGQEEILWWQKSRKDWIMHGDRNTKFFHQKTIVRMRRNKIEAIQDNSGNWLYNAEEIRKHAVGYFSALFTSEAASQQAYLVPNYFPTSEAFDLDCVDNPVLEAEIKNAVFSMKPFKAPGTNGLHAIFYQSQWAVVRPSFCKFITDIFTTGKIPKEVNTTLLVLIPKVEHPTSLKMFRPISLCTVAYKTVTKIIVNRLQAVLPEIIGPQQTSFVPGRHIIDNIVVAQEVIHSMRRKTGKRGFMAIKVDLEKAYDRLNWSFIFETLQLAGIPVHLSRLIMECVTTTTMSILWNGEVTEDFYPERGIRQGDPLSPYIFVLCIERLSHGISQAVWEGSWKPIRLAKRGTPLTHLFFADDLLLFAEASLDQASIIDAVLENFCRNSEAKVNKLKTKVFFSKNVQTRDAKLIGDALGFSATKDLGCYLGMPLIHSRVNKTTYQSILDKVGMRLTGWNAAHLSFAGRVTLAQSVVQAMPIYAMQTTLLPSSVRQKIDTACRRFIWDGKSKRHKLSLVSWDRICTPKNHGGLGFKKLAEMNHALLMKLSWEVVSNSDKLWVKVVCSKYGVNPNKLPLSLPDKPGYRIWMAIRQTWEDTMNGARWSVGDSVKTRFWLDCWVTKKEPLVSIALQPIPQVIINASVSEFVSEHGGWQWLRFEHLFPNFIIMQIASVMPPAFQRGADRIYWSFDPKGFFTVRSAYDSICHQNLAIKDDIWSLAWEWKGPQSIRLFLWQIMHGKLKTHGELARRHIPVSTACDRCGAPVEDILHALRDCQCIKRVWLRIVPEGIYHPFFHANLREWIIANLQSKSTSVSNISWECVFGVAAWRLWFWRNHYMVEGKLVDSSTISMDIMARASEIHRVNKSHMSQQPRRKEIFIGWQPPPWPWCKLNTDGSVRNEGNAGAGGVIRDSIGYWISGFCMNIGECPVVMAELWGLYQGLILAWDAGIKRLLVEVDSLCISQMISKQEVVPNVFYALVVAVRDLLSRNWQVSLNPSWITFIY